MKTPKRQFALSGEFRARLEEAARKDPEGYMYYIHPLLEALNEAVWEIRDLKAERLLRAAHQPPAARTH